MEAAAIAKAQRFTLFALTVHYGQRHAREPAEAGDNRERRHAADDVEGGQARIAQRVEGEQQAAQCRVDVGGRQGQGDDRRSDGDVGRADGGAGGEHRMGYALGVLGSS